MNELENRIDREVQRILSTDSQYLYASSPAAQQRREEEITKEVEDTLIDSCS